MRTRTLSLLLSLSLLLVGLLFEQAAFAIGAISLRATPSVLLADGTSVSTIVAEVTDSSGRPATSSVEVQFQTDLGTLSQANVRVVGGSARVRLTSARIVGVANIRAFAPSLGAAATTTVAFTDDPTALFQGNQFMQISGTSYLAYSVNDQVVEAQGKSGGARLVYRNLDIIADKMQLQCKDMILRAHECIIKRGKTEIKASRLYYNLASNQGYGIAELEGKLQTVSLNGETLRLDPHGAIPANYFAFPNLQIKLVIVARSITYFPNDRLQFRRPKFYQDQAQILSLPYYEVPLNSQELFSDQFVSVGTNGLGLVLPFYYNMTPNETGTLYLRHQQQLGRSYYGNRPGWSIDVFQDYMRQGNQRVEGSYGFTGLTRSDWGFRWTHSQEFNANSSAVFNVDFPQHQSVIGTTNFNQQGKQFRWGLNFIGGQTLAGLNETTWRNDLFWETNPKSLARSKDYTYTVGTNFSTGRTISGDPLIGKLSQTTQEINFNAYSRAFALNKRTSLINQFSLGQVWGDKGATGTSSRATLRLEHILPGGNSFNIIYDYLSQPSGYTLASGQHRLSLAFNVINSKRFYADIYGSAYLDSSDASVIGNMFYSLGKGWRVIGGITLQRFGDSSFRDLQLTVGRQIGARELQFTYSTLTKRFSLDLTATRF